MHVAEPCAVLERPLGPSGFSWDASPSGDVPAGSSPKGKGSSMTIKGGGEIVAPDGFRISSGGSSIEVTPGGIVIKGPVVTIVGAPVKLNC